jgi:hypothetical protein
LQAAPPLFHLKCIPSMPPAGTPLVNSRQMQRSSVVQDLSKFSISHVIHRIVPRNGAVIRPKSTCLRQRRSAATEPSEAAVAGILCILYDDPVNLIVEQSEPVGSGAHSYRIAKHA